MTHPKSDSFQKVCESFFRILRKEKKMFKPRKPVNRRKKLEEENGVDMEIEGNYGFD